MFDVKFTYNQLQFQVFDISLICIFDLFFYANFDVNFDVFSTSIAHWGGLFE